MSLAVAMSLTFSLVACGGTKNASESNGNSSAVSDSTLKVQFDVEVASMDPQIATDGTSFEVIAAITEGLYSVDAEGNTIYAMAESAEKSEDGLTYTFKLKDAKWSNGTPVTANDFVFAWRRLADPKTASEYAFMASIAGFKNADAILANGPYKVSSYEPAATTVELVKNDEYWDAANVKLDGIQFQVIKEAQQTMLAYQNGDLDVATLAGEQVEQFKGDPEFNNVAAGFLWFISPNQKVKGLENENLRKALALSFDKEAVVNNILKDGSIVADFAVPKLLATGPDGEDFREGIEPYLSTDKEKAKEYFEKAKKELGQETFSYKLMLEDTESAQNVAQFIQAEVQETLPGVTIELEVMPKKNRVERMQAGDYEVVLTRWGPDYADPMTYLDMWTTDSSNNYGSWSNAEYDAIIKSAKDGDLSLDPEARWEALKEAEKMAMDEAVIFPIYQKGNAVMIKGNVSGVEHHSVGVPRIFKNAAKN